MNRVRIPRYDQVYALGDCLRSGLEEIIADSGSEYTVVGIDSMFKLLFAGGPGDTEQFPRTGADVRSRDADRWARLLRPAAKDRGVLLPPNQFESQFVSAAYTEDDIDRTLEAYKHALA
ncbi:PLP-dependent aminotransferase family protein [Halosimplex aquaticum]|nr:hypothetical protein [Halosimplex aquaticum]